MSLYSPAEAPAISTATAKPRLPSTRGSRAWRRGYCTISGAPRSLMSRAGVRPDIAKRVMGHAIGGVEGVYDRHRYDTEKAAALAALAELVAKITHK